MRLTIYKALCLFLICISLSCEASEKEAFYAVSSLRFYLDQHLRSLPNPEQPSEDSIVYQDEDIAMLWQTALSSETLVTAIEQARQDYYQALEHSQNSESYIKFIESSENQLAHIWNGLRQSLLMKQNPIKLQSHLCHFQMDKKQEAAYPNFDHNPFIDGKARSQLKPYLLPLHHSMKYPLDTIFTKTRATQDDWTVAAAGFRTLYSQPISFIKVVSHPALPGYLLKLYLDSELREKDGKPGWMWLAQRCEGAGNIRRLIRKEKIRHFVVPDKWIYPLPVYPAPLPLPIYKRQPVVLLVQDMQLAGHGASANAWMNLVTYDHLDELYVIISHGYASKYLIGNIPYTKYGKFACIDTEYPKRKPDYEGVKRYLSPAMQKYWDSLVRKGGKR